MQKFIRTLAIIGFASFAVIGCKKNDIQPQPMQAEISQEILAKIANQGFGTSDVQKTEGGYLVEGDIILSEEFLNSQPGGNLVRIANNEQYRTTNLVSSPRPITVSLDARFSNANFSAAVDAAIARYNAQGLTLTFSRVSSGGDINIRIVNTGQYIASAGFPSGGNPYPEVKYAKMYSNYGIDFMTTVLAHEIGHCIGFRHTDYMDRSYSCGGAYSNEGASSVGAHLIPGTPSGPDDKSWMLACLSATTNRPFNANDVIALKYLY